MLMKVRMSALIAQNAYPVGLYQARFRLGGVSAHAGAQLGSEYNAHGANCCRCQNVEPRRMHAKGSQLGIHILVVAYRNTTHYSVILCYVVSQNV